MKTRTRSYNAIVNSLFGILSSLVTVFLNFFVRVFIVRELGDEVNGLHNLFQNITNVMALMEMGISTAMVIHLYKPIEDGDREAIRSVMSYYRRIYLWISGAFLAVCLLFDLFFLDRIVTTDIPMWDVRLFFFVYALSFGLNYLTYHKRSILFAEQKNRVSVLSTTVCEIVFRSLQIFTMILWRNYLVFLILLIFEKVISNAICTAYVNRYHPYLRSYAGAVIPAEKKKSIFDTVRPLFVNQVAGTVQKSSSSILVSKLLGNISVVGYYGNYQLVISTAELLFSQFGAAFTSSFGNLAVEGDRERMYRAYRRATFVMNSVAVVICAGFYCCIQDFIFLIFGEHYLLDSLSVTILMVSLLIYLYDIPVISVQNALGLHRKDEILMVVQALAAIALGFAGGKLFGMSGILAGMILPTVLFTFLCKGILITKTAFSKGGRRYLLFCAAELGKAFVCIAVTDRLCAWLPLSGSLAALLVHGLIAVAVCAVLLTLFSFRSVYFREAVRMVTARFRR